MEKTLKKISLLQILSLASIVIGAIFGIVAMALYNEDAKYIILAVILIAALVGIITGVIALVGVKKGQPKTAILSLSRTSLIQAIGPIAAFVLGVLGLLGKAQKTGTDQNVLLVILIVVFIIALFATSLIIKSLQAFRKDKESYTYTTVVSFIAAGSLTLFGIVSIICSCQCLSAGYETIVALLIVFSVFFVLADILSFLSVGFLAKVTSKVSPEKTAADADAKMFDQMLDGINKINTNQSASSVKEDPVELIRKYKQLCDEGIITKEEFEAKKKDLLK